MAAELIDDNINNLGDFVEGVCLRFAHHQSYSCEGVNYNFQDIEQQSRQLAYWLQRRSDLTPGDRIMIQLPNIIQYPIVAYAAMRAGLVIVNSNADLSADEMSHQINDSGAKVIVVLGSMVKSVAELAQGSSLKTILCYGLAPRTSSVEIVDFDRASQLFSHCNKPIVRTTKLDDICMLQYTAGTSGISKGAILTHRGVLSNINQIYQRLNSSCCEGQEVVICPLPLHHIYGFVLCMLMFFGKGNLNVLVREPRDSKRVLAQVRAHQFSVFCGTNDIFKELYSYHEFSKLDFSSLKLTLSGGSSLSLIVEQHWEQLTGCAITEGYGLSEASPVVCLNFPHQEQLGTIGKALIHTSVEIRDRDNQPVHDGEEGEIVIKGPQVMQGYWNLAAHTNRVMTHDGFFKTGDVGIKRPNGCIKIVDRMMDVIIVSGVTVYPNEIEEVLMSNPLIKEAAVIGEFDSLSGESVIAYITVNQPTDNALLFSWAKEFLTGYKIPQKIIIVNELPKSSIGKVLRRKLRAIA